jgi:hypothetical protein
MRASDGLPPVKPFSLKVDKMSAGRKEKKAMPQNNWINSLLWFGICLLLFTVLSRLV